LLDLSAQSIRGMISRFWSRARQKDLACARQTSSVRR
jgi:hypothetical protein